MKSLIYVLLSAALMLFSGCAMDGSQVMVTGYGNGPTRAAAEAAARADANAGIMEKGWPESSVQWSNVSTTPIGFDADGQPTLYESRVSVTVDPPQAN